MVESLYFVPAWFYNIDIALSILFVIITAVVAAHSLKIYKLSKERDFKLFGVAFVMLSLSYLIRMLLNVYLTNSAHGVLMLLFGVTNYGEWIIYLYVALFALGYLTLAYTTLKIRSVSAYIMLAVLSLVAIIGSDDKSLVFYFIASLFLLFLVVHYYQRARSDKNKNIRAIFAAFLLLFVSNVSFMLIGDYSFYYGYILSEAAEIIAYALIALTMLKLIKDGIKIINHGQKKG